MSLRALLRDNTHAELLTFQGSNPALVSVHRVRPESITAWPMAYVGNIRQTFTTDWQTRQHTGEVDVVFVGAPVDNESLMDGLDDLADAWVEWASDRPHLYGSNTVQEPTRVATASVGVGDVAYDAVIVTLGRILVLEGRS